jgi:hypothetical protein
MSDKVGFRIKSVRKHNKSHFILIKGTIHQEEIILNKYAPNISPPKYTKNKQTKEPKTLMDLKAQTDSNIVTVGDLYTLLSPTDRLSRQKNHKEISDLIDTLDQMDIVDIHIVFHSNNHEIYILISSLWNFLQNRSYFRTQNKS